MSPMHLQTNNISLKNDYSQSLFHSFFNRTDLFQFVLCSTHRFFECVSRKLIVAFAYNCHNNSDPVYHEGSKYCGHSTVHSAMDFDTGALF